MAKRKIKAGSFLGVEITATKNKNGTRFHAKAFGEAVHGHVTQVRRRILDMCVERAKPVTVMYTGTECKPAFAFGLKQSRYLPPSVMLFHERIPKTPEEATRLFGGMPARGSYHTFILPQTSKKNEKILAEIEELKAKREKIDAEIRESLKNLQEAGCVRKLDDYG